jgi:3-oxoacyl-[acyl-carrier-protein] synthase-3
MRKPEPVVEILSTGRYLPPRILTNQELEKMVDTSDEWIRERTGIRERRIAGPDMSAAFMGSEAARCAMSRAGVEPGEVDVLIVSTATPDRLLPSTACDMQAILGTTNAMAFDVSAACSGFLYAASLAEGYVAARRADIALIVATEKMSSILDWQDRSTCILFGDGAGAMVLRRAEGGGRGILSHYNRSDGRLAELLWRPAGGAAIPIDVAVLERRDQFMKMAGREVFKHAVRSMAEAADLALQQAGLTGQDVDLLIPHQANMRIIDATAKYAGIPMEKVFVNVDRYGNMSSASVPVALDEAREQGIVGPGSTVLMVAFGAGLTWGAMALRL